MTESSIASGPSAGGSHESVDPFNDEFRRCPFHGFAHVREAGAVVRATGLPLYLVARYEDCLKVLNDPERFPNTRVGMQEAFQAIGIVAADAGVLAKLSERSQSLTPVLNFTDGQVHGRHRRLVNRWFTPRRVEKAWAEIIERNADELIDGFIDRGRVELTHEFAVPLMSLTIAEIIGFERSRWRDIARWSDHLVTILGRRLTVEQWHAYADSYLEMVSLIDELLDARMKEPRDDLASTLARHLQAETQDEPLSIDEARGMLVQLLIGGNETARQTLTYSFDLLARKPELQQRLRDDPALIPAAVEEALRWVSPALGAHRAVRETVELDGQQIPAGAVVAVMFGSANHDERVFPNPDEFDIDRPNLHEHVAFGHGVHFCIGAGLARGELRTAFRRLLGRLDDIRIVEGEETVEPGISFMLRDRGDLHLAFSPVAAR